MNPIDGEQESEETYKYYVDTFIQFQKMFNYSGPIQSFFEIPYCLLQDVILAKIKDQKAEKDKIAKLKKNHQSMVINSGINDKF